MSKTIDRHGPEMTIQGYEAFAQDASYYSVWDSQTLKYCYPCNEEGKAVLIENLNIINQNGNQTVFTLKFHDEKKPNSKTPIIGSFNFRIVQPQLMNSSQVMGNMPQGGNAELLKEIMNLKLQNLELQQKHVYERRIEELEAQLLATEMEDEDDDDEEEDGIMGQIGRMGEKYPWIQETIKEGMTLLKHLFNKNKPMNAEQSAQIAGINEAGTDEQKAQQALHVLYTNDPAFTDKLVKLAKLIVKDPDLYELAIKKLDKALED